MPDAPTAPATLATHPCARDGALVLNRADDPHHTDLCPPCTAALFQARVASLQTELDDARSDMRQMGRDHARHSAKFHDLCRDLYKLADQLGIEGGVLPVDDAPAPVAWPFIPGDVLPADTDLDAAPFGTLVRDERGTEWAAGAGPRRRWYETEERFDSRTSHALLRECSPLKVVSVPPEPPRMFVLPDQEAFTAVVVHVFGRPAGSKAEHFRSWLGTRTITEQRLHKAIHKAREEHAAGRLSREAFAFAVWDDLTGKLDL